MSEHRHDSYQCPAHARGCTCPNLRTYLCNPYWIGGHCPDDFDLMPGDEEAWPVTSQDEETP